MQAASDDGTSDPMGEDDTAPFAWLVADSRRRAFAVALALTAAVASAFALVGAPLDGPDTPLGLVSLQFVADPARAAGIVAGWGQDGRGRALFLLGLDMLFPLAYASSIGLAASIVAMRDVRVAGRHRRACRAVARAALLAAVLDGIENAAMVRTVLGIAGDLAAPVTVAMAVPKYALVVGSLVGLGVLAVRRRGARGQRIRPGAVA